MKPSNNLVLAVSNALIADVLDESILNPLSSALRDMKIMEPKEALKLTDDAINLALGVSEYVKGAKCTNILHIYDYVVNEIYIDKAKKIIKDMLNTNISVNSIQAAAISAINDVMIIHPELKAEGIKRIKSIIKD